jgi:hypothetical protein
MRRDWPPHLLRGSEENPPEEADERHDEPDQEAPLGAFNDALGSPATDAQASAEPSNPADAAASRALRSPARAALVFNALGIVLILVGLAAIAAGMWVLQPVWLWMVIGAILGATGIALLLSARRPA